MNSDPRTTPTSRLPVGSVIAELIRAPVGQPTVPPPVSCPPPLGVGRSTGATTSGPDRG